MPIENASMMIPGFSREIPIKDLPLEATDAHRGSNLLRAVKNNYGFNEFQSGNLDRFISGTAEIESEGGTINPDSSARGIYQFLSAKGGGQNAFDTALNRLERLHRNWGMDVPEWLDGAREHGDPNLLSREQQEDLFVANLYQQKGTDRLFRGIGDGDVGAAIDLYMDHHHGGGGSPEARKAARNRSGRIYGDLYSHGGLIRDVHGRTLI